MAEALFSSLGSLTLSDDTRDICLGTFQALVEELGISNLKSLCFPYSSCSHDRRCRFSF